jgi:hypothetical protein
MQAELRGSAGDHAPPPAPQRGADFPRPLSPYDFGDLAALQGGTMMRASAHLGLTSIDELLERDR